MGIINGKTSLVGVLGQPVSHSISPVMHNAALNQMGLDWCYLAFPCEKEDIDEVLKTLLKINCKGLNITLPHKTTVAKLCKELTPIAKRTGAVNTLIRNQKNGWTGTNTDVEGFIYPLQSKQWKGKKAIVLGCGGSASAGIAGLQDLDFESITVIGRTAIKLKAFLDNFNKNSSKYIAPSTSLKGILTHDLSLIDEIKTTDLVVNTTPVGMRVESGNEDEDDLLKMPLGKEIWKHLKAQTILYDLIYTPNPTNWLAWGNQLGCKSIDGLEMLVQQGAASLRIWSEQIEVPINVMRKAAEKQLKV